MALSAKSALNYGITVTALNNRIDFKNSSGGSVMSATLNQGTYSPSGLAQEVALQIQTLDATNIYTVSVARNIMGGTQNRLTVSTNGTFLSLLFGTGPNASISSAAIMGFNASDYTGSTTYTGSTSMGTYLIPDFIGYNYLDPNNMGHVYGAVNISASGLKEAVTFSIQNFIEVTFKYEKKSNLLAWKNYFSWVIQQKPFDFIPEISSPDTAYNVTLESTAYDKQGLGFQMPEMLPDFPNFYETGILRLRIIENLNQFVL